MPSFDIVCEVDHTEVKNATNQVRKELQNRFDFKGVQWEMTEEKSSIDLHAESEFKLRAIIEILLDKLAKRGVSLKNIDQGQSEVSSAGRGRQVIKLKEGLEPEVSKKIVASLKAQKLKVTPSIEGDKVRVSGKNRDDLQTCISHVRQMDLPVTVSFSNFRD
jgi:cyclic-di-GMP-binding protein